MSKLENHYNLIEQLSLATGIPVNVWKDQAVLYSKSAIYFPFNIALGYLQEYLNPETPIFILVSSDNIATGYVYMKEEHAYLLVGPVSHFEISTSIAARICQELDIPASAMPDLRTYFYQIPPTPISRFRDTLNLAYSILNPGETTPDICLHHLKPRTSRSMPHPLALYIFTSRKKAADKILSRCGFGGGCVNDTVIHLASSEMGFGGFGESGMGAYHGKAGFDTFTHYKSIVDKKTWLDLPMRYQPYKRIYNRLVHLFLR